jgi:5'-nucleotidase
MGTNLGNAIWHSGKMAAARQRAMLGVRGIALSMATTGDETKFEAVGEHVEKVLEILLRRDDLRLVNVNLPPEPRGIRWVRQAVEKYDGEVVPANDPYGRPIYWLTVTQIEEHSDGTDLWAFQRGYITITPLTIDITAGSALSDMPDSERVIEFDTKPSPVTPIVEEGIMREAESVGTGPATGNASRSG